MIIGTCGTLEVGKTYHEGWIMDNNQVPHDIPFFVVREATEAEWRQDVEESGGPKNPVPLPNARFYQISID